MGAVPELRGGGTSGSREPPGPVGAARAPGGGAAPQVPPPPPVLPLPAPVGARRRWEAAAPQTPLDRHRAHVAEPGLPVTAGPTGAATG